jgi:two-component system NarL family sensor kinase
MPKADEERHATPRSLASQVLAARECEQKRVANQLRESLAPAIAGIKLTAEQALAAMDAGSGGTALGALPEIFRFLQAALDEVRRISTDLGPSILDDLGLAAVISWFCREFRKTHSDIDLDLDLQVPEQDVPKPVKIAIYCVLQEATDNVVRHAQARHLLIVVRRRPVGTDLLVADDGRGFDATVSPTTHSGLGFAIMKERVESLSGSFTVGSVPNQGTWVRALWPSV